MKLKIAGFKKSGNRLAVVEFDNSSITNLNMNRNGEVFTGYEIDVSKLPVEVEVLHFVSIEPE